MATVADSALVSNRLRSCERIVDLLEAWAADLTGQNMAQGGLMSYKRALRRCALWLDPDAAVDDLTEELITAYRDDLMARGHAPKSVGLWLSAIRKFCRWCVRTHRLPADPTQGIVWPKVPKPLPRRLNSDEWALLHGALAAPRGDGERTVWMWRRNRRAMLIMVYAGLRLKEVADLAWADIDLARGVLIVRHGKGDKMREVPIAPALRVELEAVPVEERVGAVCGRRDGRHLREKSLAHVFERWLPAQGLDDVSAHRLRHTCATLMRDGGAQIDDIGGILGHESVETTQIYLGPNPERLRAAVEVIPPAPKARLRLVQSAR